MIITGVQNTNTNTKKSPAYTWSPVLPAKQNPAHKILGQPTQRSAPLVGDHDHDHDDDHAPLVGDHDHDHDDADDDDIDGHQYEERQWGFHEQAEVGTHRQLGWKIII